MPWPILNRRIVLGSSSGNNNTSPYIEALGGDIFKDGDYVIHDFKINDDWFQIVSSGTAPNNTYELEILGGGGSGGSLGGGGGGERYYSDATLAVAGFWQVKVGIGGPQPGVAVQNGNDGESSFFNTIEALGGGGGGSFSTSDKNGRNGGNGGGSGTESDSPYIAGSPGVGNPGNDGGNALTGASAGGGGGGMGSIGGDGNSTDGGSGGNGGDGSATSISGVLEFVCAGGGGSGLANAGIGGSGVGGNGRGLGGSGTPATSPVQNTGSGGGAGFNSLGTAGADGRVRIRYYNPNYNPSSGGYYKFETILDENQSQFAWRDGAAITNLSGTTVYIFNGWNDNGAFAPNTTTNKILKSTDGGTTWTSTETTPWAATHSMCYGTDRNASLFWKWGGDFLNLVYRKDVWTYDGTDFTELTSDWGSAAGDRILMAGCVHKGYPIMSGGQDNYGPTPTLFTDTVAWNGTTFVKIGDLPVGLKISSGAMISDGTDLFIAGGGEYNSSGHNSLNDNLYKSTNDGVAWGIAGPLPGIGRMYNSLKYMNGVLFYFEGAEADGTNHGNIFYSPDKGVTWLELSESVMPAHARAVCTNYDDSVLYIGPGNVAPDFRTITRTNY